MPSKSPKPAGPHTPPPEDYSNWVRTAMRNIAATPDAAVLFDSTIKEPTELLAQVVRGAFGGEITDRYESVFANGNRFVAAAVAQRYGVQPANVLCTTGATSAMAMAIRAFVEPGDHVIVETPCFDLLPGLGAIAYFFFHPRRAVVSRQVALTGVAQQRKNGAVLAALQHFMGQLEHADEVGARGRPDLAPQ